MVRPSLSSAADTCHGLDALDTDVRSRPLPLARARAAADAGPRLDAIKTKGVVTCGLGDNVAGFSRHEAGKNWSGFDVDLCRAIAAAILGDPAKAAFRPLDVLPRFLQSHDIDVVLRGLTWTFGREARSDVRFGPIVFYDGQTFLVPKRSNIQTRRAACRER